MYQRFARYEKMYYLCSVIKKQAVMRLTKREKDLIEAIRNFQASKGWMYYQDDFYLDIHERLDNLLFETGPPY